MMPDNQKKIIDRMKQSNQKKIIDRILIIGDGGVGKTSYIRKKIGLNFEQKYFPTEGIEKFKTDTTVWYDFPGQYKYFSFPISQEITRVIFMYDVKSKISYKNLDYWRKYVKENYGNIPSITIGNKKTKNNKKKPFLGMFFRSLNI